jgi:hypothetical protein
MKLDNYAPDFALFRRGESAFPLARWIGEFELELCHESPDTNEELT